MLALQHRSRGVCLHSLGWSEGARACAIRLSQLVLLLIDFSGYILLSTGASPPLPAPLIEPTPLLTSPLLLLLNPQPFSPELSLCSRGKVSTLHFSPRYSERCLSEDYSFFWGGFGRMFTLAALTASVKSLNF